MTRRHTASSRTSPSCSRRSGGSTERCGAKASLDQATKEVARIRNARTVGCRYCRNVRFAGARAEGLDEEAVALVDAGFEGSRLSERHKLAIRWTDAFLQDPAHVDPGLRDAMLREFRPDELVELTVGLALFQGFAKIAVALGQQPDAMPVTVIPSPDPPRPPAASTGAGGSVAVAPGASSGGGDRGTRDRRRRLPDAVEPRRGVVRRRRVLRGRDGAEHGAVAQMRAAGHRALRGARSE